ncbi:MAG: HalOD1 output domain-containing protein [Haloarculaceae archaeon]
MSGGRDVEYDPTTDAYRVVSDPARDGAVGTDVAFAVAAVEDVDPTDLPPLGETLDPSALDDLVRSLPAGGSVQFTYAGHLVTVRSGGGIVVERVD